MLFTVNMLLNVHENISYSNVNYLIFWLSKREKKKKVLLFNFSSKMHFELFYCFCYIFDPYFNEVRWTLDYSWIYISKLKPKVRRYNWHLNDFFSKRILRFLDVNHKIYLFSKLYIKHLKGLIQHHLNIFLL